MHYTARWHKAVATSATVLVLTGAWAGTARADTLDDGGFEAFQIGDVNGQHGWQKTNPAYDVQIADPTLLGVADMGQRALRVSNKVTSGSFGDHTFSPSNVDEAGESAAEGDGLAHGVRQRHFESSFTFTSASPDVDQTGLIVGISPDRGDGARMSLVRLYDQADGLKVTVLDGDFTEHTVAQGLSRSGLHSLNLVMDFAQGKRNDLVTVTVDDAPMVTVGSWETYYEESEGVPTRAVDSLLIRPTSPAQPSLPGQGLLIDRLVTSTSAATATTARLGGCDVSVDFATAKMALLQDCSTSKGLDIGEGWTLDGAGHTITAVDPAGGAFSGDVVSVQGGAAHIKNLHVTSASGAANSGGAFNGIRFLKAGGSVTHTTVSGITHGNGVQEGRAIVVDNRGGAGQQAVTLDDVEVSRYQKSGVIAYGDVDLTIDGSTIGSAAAADGSSLASQIAANAVTVVGGQAVITGSHISGNEWNGDDAATAVLAVDGASVRLARNVIDGRNTDVGVYASGAAVDMTCNLVTRTITDADPQDAYGFGLVADGGGSVDSTGTSFSLWNKAIHGAVTVQPDASACAPAAPHDVMATGGIGQAAVTWADDDVPSAPVTEYVVSAPGVAPVIVAGNARTAKITGLVAGHSYAFTVKARNAWGTSETTSSTLAGTTLTSSLSRSTVTYGSATTLRGTVKATGAAMAGAKVQVLIRKSGSTAWKTVGTATTASNGSFALSVKPVAKSEIRARYLGGTTTLGTDGAVKTVQVRTKVTAKLTGKSVAEGAKVSLAGKVAPSHARQRVTLQRSAGHGVWVTQAMDKLDANSRYSFRLPTWQAGQVTYRVFKAGDADHAQGWSARHTLKIS